MKVSKASVDYSEGKLSSRERCGNCKHFVVADNECTLVKGFIQARMWCKLWKGKNAPARN